MLRKIIVWVIFASFLSTQNAVAKWYGNDEYTIVPNSGIQDCRPDTERDVIGPSFDLLGTPLRGDLSPEVIDKNVSGKGFLKDQARVVSVSGNKFYCQKWDSTLPNTNAIVYHNGEVLESIVKLNLMARDRGGSGLHKFEVQYRDSTEESGFSDWSEWKDAGSKISSSINTEFSFMLPDTKSKMKWFQFRFKVIDVAWNASSSWQTASNVLKGSAGVLGWYGKHTENFDSIGKKWAHPTYDIGGKSFCNEDDHVDGHWNNTIPSYVPNSEKSRNPSSILVPMAGEIVPTGTYDGNGGQWYYVRQARAVSQIPTTGNPNKMQCEMWDGTSPWTESISYHNGWTNNTLIAINIKAKDYGGSFSSPLSVNLTGGNAQLKAEWEVLRISNRSGINAPKLEIPAAGDIPFNIWVPYIVIQKQTSINGPDFTTWSNWENVDIFDSIEFTTTNSTDLNGVFKFRAPNTPGTAYKFRYKVIDGAGNESDWKEWEQILKLDTEKPSDDPNDFGVKVKDPNDASDDSSGDNSGNIPRLTDDNNNFMAGENSPIQIVYNNRDGSPIKIVYSIEKDNPATQFVSKTTTDFKYKFSLDDEYKKVDNDLNIVKGGRDVTLIVTKIIDEAGNEKILNKNFTFNVFANILLWFDVQSSADASNKNVADGQENYYTQKIFDKFGNGIIPALKIGRTLKRTTESLRNTMYLDQQTRVWWTSVFVNGLPLPQSPNWKINPTNSETPLIAGTSEYRFKVQVYTPTANAYDDITKWYGKVSDDLAAFSLKSWLAVWDNQTKIRSSDSVQIEGYSLNNPIFAPLFTNKITGDLLNGGFIEGAVQTSKVETARNSLSSVNSAVASRALYARFMGEDVDKFQLFRNADFSSGYAANQNSPLVIDVNFNAPSVTTFLKQRDWSINSQSKLSFSAHFAYLLDGKSVVYNSDVIGRDHYHANSESALAQQVGVKIIGHTSTHNFKDIIQGNPTQNTVMQNVGTAEFRNSIRASVAEAIRNINLQNTVGTKITNFANLPSSGSLKGGIVSHEANKSIMYIEWNGGTVTLENLAKISGTRTLVLRGLNLYIKSDMSYNDSNSILGVVIQKNANGQGGKLYIDPGVTNIVGAYVVDDSVYSYNGTEVGATNIATLKNQLHIYGSIVSYNTIGGSRANPVQCPNISVSVCNPTDAQKYDLNFLRRYYLVDGKPFGNAKVIGGGTINDSRNVTGQKSDLIQKFTKTSDDLAKYPVIIEFNPAIIGNPPLGFDVYRQ